MTKLLLIEDNFDDYKVLYDLLKHFYTDAEIFPDNAEEHDILRKNFRKLFSGEILVSEEAESYFNVLNINNFTGVLLDYQLDEGCKKTNGIQFYKDAKINIPALILTKFTGIQYVNVEAEIEREGLKDIIIPLQKGLITNLSQAQKDYYIKNINEHILKMTQKITTDVVPKKVLIVTTTKIETTEFHSRMTTEGLVRKMESKEALTFWNYGKLHNVDVTMIKLTEMGSAKSGGSTISVADAIDHLNTDYIIMIGIAFGLKPKKQNIGDILVSRELQDYDSQKQTETSVVDRGHRIPAGRTLLNRFDNASQMFTDHNVEVGLIISGGTLTDNLQFVEKLQADHPEAIGGEMEGIGLQSSCLSRSKEWILIKGICDWGHNKDVPTKDQDQKTAIANVCDFLMFTFENFTF
jgi:nucleoside phosphorylase